MHIMSHCLLVLFIGSNRPTTLNEITIKVSIIKLVWVQIYKLFKEILEISVRIKTIPCGVMSSHLVMFNIITRKRF